MADDEEVQYRIEIQDGHGFGGTDGEIMVVLDLNGQDLPESVAQTILELAQNSRNNQGRGLEPFSQVLVTENHGQVEGENYYEMITKEPVETFTDPTVAVPDPGVLNDVKFESMDDTDIVFTTEDPQQVVIDGNPPRILVKNLAELEQLKAKNPEVIAPFPNRDDGTAQAIYLSQEEPSQFSRTDISQAVRISKDNGETSTIKPGHVSTLPFKFDKIKKPVDAKVEIGVQCEILNVAAKGKSQASAKNPDMTAREVEAESPIHLKHEPLWADENVGMAAKPTEPEETAMVPPPPPPPPPVEKSCPQCDFSCSDDLEYGRHLKQVHKEKKPFMCSVCSATFEVELSFQIHLLLHAEKPTVQRKTKGQRFSCPVCSFECTTRKKLGNHVKDKHKVEIFSCSNCRFSSLSETELAEHVKSKCRRGRRKMVSICPVCHVACLRLANHLVTNHPDHRPYPCSQCDHKSKTIYALKAHERTHMESKEFKCPHCPRACKSKVSLKRHILNHNPNRKFKCSQCSFSTNDSYEHKRHALRVHTRKTYYSCKFCNLSFVNHCDLKLHAMSEHQSRDQFYCKFRQCTFSCETRVEFKRHTQTHTGKHRYLCDICDFTTPFRAHLDRHLAVHKNLRPFKCEVCGYECREKINLKKHMVIHSDSKPFQCPQCSYSCKLKNLLDSHMRIMHTSLRPFKCTRCTYRTKTASNLRKHMWIHEEYRPFSCRFCPYTAREKNKLRRHEKLKHRDGNVQQDDTEAKEEKPEVPEVLPSYKIIFSTSMI